MKHSKYISLLLAGSVLLTSSLSSVYAADMMSWFGNTGGTMFNFGTMTGGANTSTNTNTSNSISDSMGGANGLANMGQNGTDDNASSNSDFSVKDYEVKNGNFSISNADTALIEGVYYVYGNLTVTNADLVVNGKLKVTGNLTVTNGDITNNGRIYVYGKKKLSNGDNNGTPAKLSADLVKYDPILRADLDKEEEAQVAEFIATMKKNVESLKKELKTAFDKNERLEVIKDKIRHEKEVFFKEIAPFIQEEDKAALEKMVKADLDATENYLVGFKRAGAPSEALRNQIEKIVAKFPSDRKSTMLNALITKLDTLLVNDKLSAKKKNLLMGVKEVIEDELDKDTGDMELDSLISGNTQNTTTATTATGTTATSTSTGTTTATTTASSGTGSTSTSTTGTGATTSTTGTGSGATITQ